MRINRALKIFTCVVFTLTLLAVFNLNISVRAQSPGDLDLSFNGTGFLQTGFENGRELARSSTLQSDGKLIVVGYAYYGSLTVFAISRYNSNGSPDTSFGNNGKILQRFSLLGGGSASSAAIQSDGKIVVAGFWSSPATSNDFAVARYNTDGSLDTTFDSDGLVTTNLGSGDLAESVAIQSDGKIVVVGQYNSGNPDFAVVRYNTNGSLDTSFSGDGIFITAVGTLYDIATTVAIQTNGSILVGGYSIDAAVVTYDFSAIRLLSNGSLDTTFSGDGKVLTGITPNGTGQVGTDYGRSIKVLSDGKIILSGDSYFSDGVRFAIVKYNANGTLDTSFDSDGIVNTFVSNIVNNSCYGLAIQPDGKIVLGGRATSRITLARYNANGSLDTTFDSDGIVTSTIGGITNSLSVQSDGKYIVSIGNASNSWGNYRFNNDGTVDTTYGSNGGIISQLGSEDDYAQAVALQPDGKILVTGSGFGASPFQRIAVARYNSNGTLDQTFGNSGLALGLNATGKSIAVQNDGKIIVGFALSNQFGIVRFNSTGSIDTTFGNNGYIYTVINSQASVEKILITSDGKILVAGFASFPTTSYDFVLVKYNSDGTLDTSFDTDGIVTTSFNGSRPEDKCLTMALQANNKIVLAGQSNGDFNYALARYNSDGSLDTTFDGDGKAEVIFTNASFGAQAIALQNDEKIVVAGSIYSFSTGYDFAAIRLNSNGSLDASFDGDGIVTTSFSGNVEDRAAAVAIQSNGKIVLAGSTNINSSSSFALVRYNADGSLDNSPQKNFREDLFGSGGTVVSDFLTESGRYESIQDALIQNDGKILVAGSIDRLFGVARYYGDLVPTAANADISGRVVDEFGNGLPQVKVSLRIAQTGEIITVYSSGFGYFNFAELPVGDVYVISVADSKRYFFEENTRVVQLFDNVTDVNFVGSER